MIALIEVAYVVKRMYDDNDDDDDENSVGLNVECDIVRGGSCQYFSALPVLAVCTVVILCTVVV